MAYRKLFIILLSVTFIGCNYSAKKDDSGSPNECTLYSCPMHPDKTSVTPAKCLECNMDMRPVIMESDSAKSENNGK